MLKTKLGELVPQFLQEAVKRQSRAVKAGLWQVNMQTAKAAKRGKLNDPAVIHAHKRVMREAETLRSLSDTARRVH